MAKKTRSSPSGRKRTPGPPHRHPVRARFTGKRPRLTVSFVSIEVKTNGWPAGSPQETDLSLILQLENPAGAEENRILASERLPFRASPGGTVKAEDLSPGANGAPFFGGPVAVPGHVNLHSRFFIERRNAIGPILGAALNTVVGQELGRVPLLPTPPGEVIHIQIGRTIATELARAIAIIPVDETMAGRHPVTIALVSPRTIPGFWAPSGSPEPYRKGILANEGDLAALLHLTLELEL